MKPLLIAVIAVVVLPIYGQEKSPKSNDQQPHAESIQKSPSGPITQNAAETQGNDANNETKSYFSRLFSPENLPNIGLFIAGVGGIIVAIYTLKSIKRQAGLMEEQLKEMQGAGSQVGQQVELTSKQVEYIVNTERAWVMGELGWYEKTGPNIVEDGVKGAERTKVFLKLTCKNQGKSPAWIDNVRARLEVISDGVLIDLAQREDLQSNGRWGPLGVGEERSRGVQAFCFSRRQGDKDFLSMLVIVEYRDIFGTKRETILGYSITRAGELLRQDGLPERNQNT